MHSINPFLYARTIIGFHEAESIGIKVIITKKTSTINFTRKLYLLNKLSYNLKDIQPIEAPTQFARKSTQSPVLSLRKKPW